MHKQSSRLILIAAAAVLSQPVNAATADTSSLSSFFSQSKVSLNSRLRLETASQDGIADDASALTLRIRLGLKTPEWRNFSGFIEYEGTSAFAGRAYAPETTGRPVIADPTGNEVNQWWLQYSAPAKTSIRLGRQRLILNNSRVVGNVGWRQNEQTFDGVIVRNQGLKNWTATAAYLHNSNFILYNDRPMRSSLVNLAFKPSKALNLAAYGLALDFDNSTADTLTLGLRLSGVHTINADSKLHYAAEFARQQDHADNAADFAENYLHGELGYGYKALTVKAGMERLGADGTTAVQFPLATLHKFNGWADKFLKTPANGLDDKYLKLVAKHAKTLFVIAWHQFSATEDSSDHGTELDLMLKQTISKQLSLIAKYADYNADSFTTDTERFSIQIDLKLP